MEKMPYRSELDGADVRVAAATVPGRGRTCDQHGLAPAPAGARRLDGHPAGAARVGCAVAVRAARRPKKSPRFISPPPTHGRRVRAVHRVDPSSAHAPVRMPASRSPSTATDTAIGIFQLRELEPGFGTAEWGFAIGSAYWGTGVFQEGAELLVSFAFETVGVHRLEARAAVRNGRGNGALRKIGAVQEGVLRKSFLKNGEYLDQALLDDSRRGLESEDGLGGKEGMIVH